MAQRGRPKKNGAVSFSDLKPYDPNEEIPEGEYRFEVRPAVKGCELIRVERKKVGKAKDGSPKFLFSRRILRRLKYKNLKDKEMGEKLRQAGFQYA